VPLCPRTAPNIASPSQRAPETRPTAPLLRLPSMGSRSCYSVCDCGVYTMFATIPKLHNRNPKTFTVFELPQLNLANTPPHMADHSLKCMKTISPEVLRVIIPACLRGRRSSSASRPCAHTHARVLVHYEGILQFSGVRSHHGHRSPQCAQIHPKGCKASCSPDWSKTTQLQA